MISNQNHSDEVILDTTQQSKYKSLSSKKILFSEHSRKNHKKCYKLPAGIRKTISTDTALSIYQTISSRATIDGYILVLGVNYGLREQLANLICLFNDINFTNWILFAFDDQMTNYSLNILQLDNVISFNSSINYLQTIINVNKCHQLKNNFTKADYEGNNRALLTRMKYLPVVVSLFMDFKVILSDVDIIYLQNPINSIKQILSSNNNQFDIVITTGSPRRNTINSGFFYANPNNTFVMELMLDVLLTVKKIDQSHMNDVGCKSIKDNSCITHYNKGNIRWYYLNPAIYASGHPLLHGYRRGTFDKNGSLHFRLTDKDDNPRVLIHSNFCNGESKVNKLKTNGFYKLKNDGHTCKDSEGN